MARRLLNTIFSTFTNPYSYRNVATNTTASDFSLFQEPQTDYIFRAASRIIFRDEWPECHRRRRRPPFHNRACTNIENSSNRITVSYWRLIDVCIALCFLLPCTLARTACDREELELVGRLSLKHCSSPQPLLVLCQLPSQSQGDATNARFIDGVVTAEFASSSASNVRRFTAKHESLSQVKLNKAISRDSRRILDRASSLMRLCCLIFMINAELITVKNPQARVS